MQLFSVVMYEILMVRVYLVLLRNLSTLRSICLSNFNVPSLKESRGGFVNLPTRSGIIGQVANISNGATLPLVDAWEHICDLLEEEPLIIIISPLLALMQDQVKKISSLDLMPLLWVQSKIQEFCRTSSEGTLQLFTFLQILFFKTERWRNRRESEIYRESSISVAVDEVHCVTEWATSINNKNRSAFRVCLWFSQFQLCHTNVGRFTSSVCNFWPLIADVSLPVSHVVTGANERRLYSKAKKFFKIIHW